ncbi:hypothetical protein HU200_029269 [Digitaria exilis]|uniref:F-box domain-containing protein n=1 Tax=Digitaria exilis TaxID=1010633 RepID=A0A835BTL7_9POAL|nr:hypothetical protein HU200_029269 [Digitaria exilis]
MPRRDVPSRREETAGPVVEDRLGALPDEALQHVLSFLPSDDAVQTCVLARRWRNLWKSTPALRIKEPKYRWENPEDMNEFVNHLLLFRDHSPLDICELDSYPYYTTDDERDKPFRYIQMWIRYALSHKVRVPRVFIYNENGHFELDSAPLVSRHLTFLELDSVELDERALDFSTCPSLKALKMTNCFIMAREISSQSLRHLIANNNFFSRRSRTLISAPSLVSLQLNEVGGRTPVLQSMPLLETALVELDEQCHDNCHLSSSGNCGHGSCEGCQCFPFGSDRRVLFRGLSNTTDLKLLAEPDVFIFKRDLTLCPTFSNLKTLLLGEWSVAVDLASVVCLLQHSPVLEMLTFRLFEEVEGGQNPAEQFAHLKTV